MSEHNALQLDALIVGAGLAGLYMLHRMRTAGMSALCLERADGVGGTWYWNRYPGARCDIESFAYSYSFSAELEQKWEWTEKFATQPEILAYINYVADRFDLRKGIKLGTSVVSAKYDTSLQRWLVSTDPYQLYSVQHLILATGCLSSANRPDIPGVDSFRGRVLHTAEWPHAGVDFTNRTVGIIGTGSSGVQSIPMLAQQAAHLDVFQRTPSYSLPEHNRPLDPKEVADRKKSYRAYRNAAKYSRNGLAMKPPTHSALSVTLKERTAAYEQAWNSGVFAALENTFTDLMDDLSANHTVVEFVHDKIRGKVRDSEVAEKLLPHMPYATKRSCLDTGYYETFNNANVRLVDVQKSPIERITETGIKTRHDFYALDDLVFATGFDAMTGAILNLDIRGAGECSIQQAWEEGPCTYLGLSTAGFPNLYFITGPGSPSVLSNMVVSIEQHVDWIAGLITYMNNHGWTTVEPSLQAQKTWVAHVNETADRTLYPQANSWYLGANIPGKKRIFMPYVGGVGKYRQFCEKVADGDYIGFIFDGESCVGEGEGIV